MYEIQQLVRINNLAEEMHFFISCSLFMVLLLAILFAVSFSLADSGMIDVTCGLRLENISNLGCSVVKLKRFFSEGCL